ncbi:Phosphoenolpyruvate carboxylase 4-like protein [Drosera capensis]
MDHGISIPTISLWIVSHFSDCEETPCTWSLTLPLSLPFPPPFPSPHPLTPTPSLPPQPTSATADPTTAAALSHLFVVPPLHLPYPLLPLLLSPLPPPSSTFTQPPLPPREEKWPWLGVGAGLKSACEIGHSEDLRAMYQEWPFFQSTIDLIEMVLGKADISIAKHYDEVLVAESRQEKGAYGD